MIAERIGFLGGGKIAQAMAKGFIAAGLARPEQISASVHPEDRRSFAAFEELGARPFLENEPVVRDADVVFVSVKPGVVAEVLREVHGVSAHKLFLSVAMGVPLSALRPRLPPSARLVRVMPNTPILVQSGCSVFARAASASDGDAALTRTLLRSIGSCEEVPEQFFDAITALSGSGPAYVYVMVEALADGGVKMGLPRDLAYRLAAQTVLGAGRMVKETGLHPGQLKDDVCSPGGSTITALHYLEQSRFRESLIGAIEKATERCRAVSREGEQKQ